MNNDTYNVRIKEFNDLQQKELLEITEIVNMDI